MEVSLSHEGETAQLTLRQSVPPTPGQPEKKPMPIPLKLALFDRDTGTHRGEELVVLDSEEATLTFDGFDTPPLLSINRGFSAPVTIEREIAQDELVFLAAKDDDPFARYEALQELVVRHLKACVQDEIDDGERRTGREAIAGALAAVLADDSLDDLMRGELLVLPSETYLAETMAIADPGAIHAERQGLRAYLATHLEDAFTRHHERTSAVPFALDADARGARKVKTQALFYLAAGGTDKARQMAWRQYSDADNMTDRQGALMVWAGMDGVERTNALLDFYNRYKSNALVVDKWFAIQAGSTHPKVIDHVKALSTHGDFTMRNPNRVRSLYMAFAYNPHAFHTASGEGYRMIADLILELDSINPQTAARFVPQLGRWRRIEPQRSAMMKAQLERIAAAPALSRDVYEQVSRSLG